MAKSAKINYIFSLLNTITGLLFGLVAFSYASRILLADYIGQINFFQSIVNYIILFTNLGIPVYAVREISKIRNDIAQRNRVVLEIAFILLILMIVGYLAVIIITTTVDKVQVDIPLFLILSLSIFLTSIGCDWFFQGIEDFKFLAIRSIVIRTVAFVALFLLVKTRDDLFWYAVYTLITLSGSSVLNIIRLRKYLRYEDFVWQKLNPKRHIKPILQIFVLNLIANIYVNLNTVMLGFMNTNDSVGLFTTATKLTQVSLAVVTSLNAVMLPRFSHLISSQNWVEFGRMAQKAVSFVLCITLPLSVGLVLLAHVAIPSLCGDTYMDAIPTLKILAPVVLLLGVSNVLSMQILFPQGQEKVIIFSTGIGAVINFVLNLLLIPDMAERGSAIATIMATLTVGLSMLWYGRRYIPIRPEKSHLNFVVGTLLMAIAVLLCRWWHFGNIWIELIVSGTVGTLVYVLYLIVAKDKICIEAMAMLKKRK